METHASIIFREQVLIAWLEEVLQKGKRPLDQPATDSFTMQAMPGDAGFRRYYRIEMEGHSYVVMDAHLAQENCHAFLTIANHLRSQGLHTPSILSCDLSRGFLLLSDFGDATYLKSLTSQNADQLYQKAIDALIILQRLPENKLPVIEGLALPHFTREWMQQEWAWHREWFLEKLLHLTLDDNTQFELNKCFAFLMDSIMMQPKVLMHRDYHSANLMLLPNQAVGLLDFQDAFIGPLTYDLVSLLRDCYIDWPNEKVKEWALYYFANRKKLNDIPILNELSETQFLIWFDLMGIERHLKAIFNFARKAVRDHQPDYLKHIPRTLQYIISVSESYPELQFLNQFLINEVLGSFDKHFLSF